MNLITGLLERYRNFQAPPLAAARAVQAAVREILGIELPEKAIRISRGRAIISVGSLEKTEILMRKGDILAKVRVVVGDSVRTID